MNKLNIPQEEIQKVYKILETYMPYRNATSLDGYKKLDDALGYYFRIHPKRKFTSRKCPICGTIMTTNIHEINSGPVIIMLISSSDRPCFFNCSLQHLSLFLTA